MKQYFQQYIGFKKNQDYITKIENLAPVRFQSRYKDSFSFKDAVIDFQFIKNQAYYITFKIHKNNNTANNVNLCLINITDYEGVLENYVNEDNNTETPIIQIQNLNSFYIPRGSDTISYSYLFSPASDFNQLMLEIEDRTLNNSDQTLTIEEIQLYKVNYIDIFNNKDAQQQKTIIKFALNAAPGSFACINGTTFIINRTGRLEFSYGYIINDKTIGVISNSNFTIDFVYILREDLQEVIESLPEIIQI